MPLLYVMLLLTCGGSLQHAVCDPVDVWWQSAALRGQAPPDPIYRKLLLKLSDEAGVLSEGLLGNDTGGAGMELEVTIPKRLYLLASAQHCRTRLICVLASCIGSA